MLINDGVRVAVFGVGERDIYVMISLFVGDAPARALCCGFPHPSSRRGCPDCGSTFPRIFSDKGKLSFRYTVSQQCI